MKIQKRKYTIAISIYILIKNDVEKKFNPKNEMIKIPSTYPASKFTQQKTRSNICVLRKKQMKQMLL